MNDNGEMVPVAPKKSREEELAEVLLEMRHGIVPQKGSESGDDDEDEGDEEDTGDEDDDMAVDEKDEGQWHASGFVQHSPSLNIEDRLTPPPPLPPATMVTFEVPFGTARVVKMKTYTPWILFANNISKLMVCPINELQLGYLCSWFKSKGGAKPRAKVLENDETLSQLYDDVNEYVAEQLGKKGNTNGVVKPFSVTLVDLRVGATTKTASGKDSKQSKKSTASVENSDDNGTGKDEHIWLKEINQAHWCEEHKEADYVVPPDGRHKKFTIEQLSQWAFLCVRIISLQFIISEQLYCS